MRFVLDEMREENLAELVGYAHVKKHVSRKGLARLSFEDAGRFVSVRVPGLFHTRLSRRLAARFPRPAARTAVLRHLEPSEASAGSDLRRVAVGSASIGFLVGAVHATWVFARQPFVLEFQAGSSATYAEKALAVVHASAIEGLGFGALGLVLGILALVGTRAGADGGRFAGRFALVAGAFVVWASLARVAEDLLPFLSTPAVLLLDLVGFAAVLAGLVLHRALVRRMPWGPATTAGADTSTSLVGVACAGAALSLVIPLITAGGWRRPGSLVGAAAVLLVSIPLAAGLARFVRPLVARLGGRLAVGPLFPRPLAWGLGGGLLLSAVGTAPLFRVTAVPGEAAYSRIAPPSTNADVQGPNVVLVTIDTLRADRLGCYGYGRPTSPFLDSLAEEGARFDDPVAPAAWTKPSTGTLLTGLYPSRHGALYHGSRLGLPDGEEALAEAFRARGYVTAGFVSNPNIKAVFGFDRGFDLYFDSPVEDTLTLACLRTTLTGRGLTDLLRHQFNWKYENDVVEMNRHALAWLRRNHEARFFLYLHYIDPHIPYSPPGRYRREFARDHGFPIHNRRKELVGGDLYDAEIRYVDDGMSALVDELRGLGVWEDTLLVVTSDHGEEFFEHGVLGHGFSLFQPVVRVPLLMHGPGIPAGRVVTEPVQLLDLPATLLDLARTGTDRLGDGRSFAGALGDEPWEPEAHYFLENEFGQGDADHRAFVLTGVRRGRWKLVLTERNAFFPPDATGREALYDLASDPRERHNLIREDRVRDVVEDLLGRLQRHSVFLAENGARDVPPTALAPDVEASLKALGY